MDGKLVRRLDLFAKQWAPRSGVCFEYTAIRHIPSEEYPPDMLYLAYAPYTSGDVVWPFKPMWRDRNPHGVPIL
jgi:hypothetical protein